MKNDVSRSLFSYWNGLRGARSAPERSCIDPSAIRHILAHTFIIEVDAAASFPFRVAGTRVNALFGADQQLVKHAPLFTWPGGEPDREGAALPLLVCDDMSPVVAGIDATTRSGREVGLELLLLPLRHHGKTHSRVLGCLTPGAMPVWMGSTRSCRFSCARAGWSCLPKSAREAHPSGELAHRRGSTPGAVIPSSIRAGNRNLRWHFRLLAKNLLTSLGNDCACKGLPHRGSWVGCVRGWMSNALKIQPRGVERRRHQRVPLALLGRFMLENHNEYPCQTQNISPGGIALITPLKGKVGERIVIYLEHLAASKARSSAISNRASPSSCWHPGARSTRWPTSSPGLANRHELELPEDRRHDRVAPHQSGALMRLPSGEEMAVRVLDLSLSGAALSAEISPPVGMRVVIGETQARVVRHFNDGFGVEFVTPLGPSAFVPSVESQFASL